MTAKSSKKGIITIVLTAGMMSACAAQSWAAAPADAHKAKHKTVKTAKAVAAPHKLPPDFHSLDEVLAWSYAHNPALLSARAAFRAAEEALPQALSGFQPLITASADITNENIRGVPNGAPTGVTSKGLDGELTQPIFHGGETLAAVKSAKASIEAQRALLRDKEQQVLLQVATAYMNVVRDKSLLDVAENNVTDLDQQLKASRDRFKVGDITKTDVSQAEAASAKATADRIDALGNLKTSDAVFEQLVGFPPGSVALPDSRLPFPATLDEATDFADVYNPEVVAATYLQQASKADVDRIFGQRLPQVNLVGDLERNYNPQLGGDPNNTTRIFGLTATVPLYTGGFITSQVRQAKYTANQRYLDILDTRRQVREDVVSSWQTLAATRAEIDSRKVQVQASRLALDGIRQEAAVGTRTVLDALDTEQLWLNAEVSLVTAQRDAVVADFTLGSAMGLLTPQVLGFPEISGEEKAVVASRNVDKDGVR